jgi:hypothetical protein
MFGANRNHKLMRRIIIACIVLYFKRSGATKHQKRAISFERLCCGHEFRALPITIHRRSAFRRMKPMNQSAEAW